MIELSALLLDTARATDWGAITAEFGFTGLATKKKSMGRTKMQTNMIRRRDALKAIASAGVVPVTLRLGCKPALAAEDLQVFDFGGYEIPELYQPYIEKYGAAPAISTYADGYEAFIKISAGFQVDLVHPGSFDVPKFRDAGLLRPWDVTRLSNWPDLFPFAADAPDSVFDGQHWMIATSWGYDSVIYREDLIDVEEESWTLLWDERYAGKIAYGTELQPAISAAAMVLGIADPFHANEEEVARIRAKLTEQRPLVKFYWNDLTTLEQAVAAGEVVAAQSWTQSFTTLQAQGVPVKYMAHPKEGVVGWIEGFCLLNDAPGKEQNAYDFVDAWIDPETGKWLMENYGYGSANKKAFELVDPAVLDAIGLSDPEQLLAMSHFNMAMVPELYESYARMYEEVQAGY